MVYQLPDVSTLAGLNESDLKELLAHLFERCDTLNDLIISSISSISYNSYVELVEAVRIMLLALLTNPSDPRIPKIIGAHPRLGSNKSLSVHSHSEQASLGPIDETERLRELNDLYEKTFPGFRYVVFVNGRSRDVIMQNMKSRIEYADIEAEKYEAFNVSSNFFFCGFVKMFLLTNRQCAT
jgi:2-oxo-4-hydroxy-4-carboxy--5-ureidoimidazoline (OHCU) decarboxylase